MTTKPQTTNQLWMEATNAKAGDWIEYFSGIALPLGLKYTRVYWLAEQGYFNLAQKTNMPPSQIGCRTFHYLMQRTSKKMPKSVRQQIEGWREV